MVGDTSLIRMVIERLAQKHKWTYEETLDRFYNSDVCKHISNRATGIFTCAPAEIIELFEETLS